MPQLEDTILRSRKLNNKGLSLVELIIAISIGVIVSGSIAALITFALRTYRNESVNTAMQYELQTNINMMTDEIMGSQTLVIGQNSGVDLDHVNDPEAGEGGVTEPYTRYALFGKFNDSTKKFTGVIFVSSNTHDSEGRFKIYMKRYLDTSNTKDTHVKFAEMCYGEVIDSIDDDDPAPNPYLLGENLTQFAVEPDPNNTCFDSGEFVNPIEVRLVLTYKRDGWGGKKYSKRVDDIAYMRNKVEGTVYVATYTTDAPEPVSTDAYQLKTKEE